jgi:SUMO ligase MMS21 Smc5/6 complex component
MASSVSTSTNDNTNNTTTSSTESTTIGVEGKIQAARAAMSDEEKKAAKAANVKRNLERLQSQLMKVSDPFLAAQSWWMDGWATEHVC